MQIFGIEVKKSANMHTMYREIPNIGKWGFVINEGGSLKLPNILIDFKYFIIPIYIYLYIPFNKWYVYEKGKWRKWDINYRQY